MKLKQFIIIGLILTVTGLIAFLSSLGGEYYRTYSPDKQYSVFAQKYNYENFLPGMLGGGGDARGRLVLYDEIEKKIIDKGEIIMLSLTPEIQWEENHAYYIGEENYPNILRPWTLPRKIKKQIDFAAP